MFEVSPLIIELFFSSAKRDSGYILGGEKLVVTFFVDDLLRVTFLWMISDPLGEAPSFFFAVSVGYRLTIADFNFKVGYLLLISFAFYSSEASSLLYFPWERSLSFLNSNIYFPAIFVINLSNLMKAWRIFSLSPCCICF